MGTKPLLLLLVSVTFINFALAETDQRAFYCFLRPTKANELNVSSISNLPCTHFVYGDIPIDGKDGRLEFRSYDFFYGIRDGYILQFLRLRQKHQSAKFLLGVVRRTQFDDVIAAKKVAAELTKNVRQRRFDGLFVTFDGPHLEQRTSVEFIKELASHHELSLPTLSVEPRRVYPRDAVESVRESEAHLEHIYLDMSRGAGDPYVVVQTDPLAANGSVYFADTIQGAVTWLDQSGISPQRIVVGFTAGGWKFEVRNTRTVSHGDFALDKGRRIDYQQACKARGSTIFDSQSLNSVTRYMQTWINYNSPTKQAMGKKIEWVLSEEMAGVGVSSLDEDDPMGLCSGEPFPNHRLVAEMISSATSQATTNCTRLCYINAQKIDDNFSFDQIQSDFCSHVVIEPFNIDYQLNKDVLNVPKETTRTMLKLGAWREKFRQAPKLIISIGSSQGNDVWSVLMNNDAKREELAKAIVEMRAVEGADGFEIARGSLSNDVDKNRLKDFMAMLRNQDKKAQVLLTTTAESSFANFYDYIELNKTVDYFVLSTHALHSPNSPVTGHTSPFKSSSNLSFEDYANFWANKGIPRSRLVVSISASATSFKTIGEPKADVFGHPAIAKLRIEEKDIDSQQEICEVLAGKSGEQKWDTLGQVPYMVRGGEVVVYDNQRSASIKSVWASVEGMGIAVRDLHADDPLAVCGSTPFPILAQVVQTQVCPRCIARHDFRKCQHNFKMACNFDLHPTSPEFKTKNLPYEMCTEMIIENAVMTPQADIKFADAAQTKIMNNITSMRLAMGKCGAVLSIKCNIGDKKLTTLLLENTTLLIDNIMSTIDKHNLTGVQLDCEHDVSSINYMRFSGFLRQLNTRITEKPAHNKCNRTLSMRLSPRSLKLSSFYPMSLLNKLHTVSMASSVGNRHDNKIYGNESSIERTIENWRRSGLHLSKITLEMSLFGQKSDGKRQTPMSQSQICAEVGNRAVRQFDFETLEATVSTSETNVTLPTEATLTYKIGFVQRSKLGGVSLSVNGDDYTGICGRGSFPLLKSIYSVHTCRRP